jgi:hypothetical protein
MEVAGAKGLPADQRGALGNGLKVIVFHLPDGGLPGGKIAAVE